MSRNLCFKRDNSRDLIISFENLDHGHLVRRRQIEMDSIKLRAFFLICLNLVLYYFNVPEIEVLVHYNEQKFI